jgi:hypothetical protein
VLAGQASENRGVGDVDALFEQQIPERQTHPLAGSQALVVGGRGQSEGRQRTHRKGCFREALKQCWRDLSADGVDLLGDGLRVEWLAVDDLEGPGPHSQGHVVAAELCSLGHEPPKADMGEGAGNVGKHLDDGHAAATSRPPWNAGRFTVWPSDAHR